MGSRRITAAVLALCSSLPATAGELEQRIDRLERTLASQNAADLVLQLQRLQQEVQELRGQLELQNHRLEAQDRRQRDLYLDLDQRLNRLSQDQPLPTEVPIAPETVAEASPGDQIAPSEAPADPAQEETDYRHAFDLLKERRYPEALAAFEAFRQAYPEGNFTDNAQYWLAETHYVTREFDSAQTEFEALLTRYPDSGKVPGALLKLGYISYEQKNWQQARELLERIQSEHPGSTEARLAATRLEKMRQEGR